MPLRSSSVQKRYSEFTQLVNQLCYELGINTKDFPYALPPKSSIWNMKNNGSLVTDRQYQLANFLNDLLRDKDLQNHPTVHEFLQLPANFKVSTNMFEKNIIESNISQLNVGDAQAIDQHKWLEYSRLFKYHIGELQDTFDKSGTIQTKVDIREKIRKIIEPNLSKLTESLSCLLKTKNIDKSEFNKREKLAKTLQNDLLTLSRCLESSNGKDSSKQALILNSRRVLGGPQIPTEAKETNETLPLDNQELLQLQLQIHQKQDQDVAELRKIIQRHKEIGTVINNEVTEQNELLDQFNQDVDSSTDKLRNARKQARKIL